MNIIAALVGILLCTHLKIEGCTAADMRKRWGPATTPLSFTINTPSGHQETNAQAVSSSTVTPSKKSVPVKDFDWEYITGAGSLSPKGNPSADQVGDVGVYDDNSPSLGGEEDDPKEDETTKLLTGSEVDRKARKEVEVTPAPVDLEHKITINTTSTAWTQQDKDAEKLFWRLYGIAINCIEKGYASSSKKGEQACLEKLSVKIRSVVVKNNKVLRARRKAKNCDTASEFTPLTIFAKRLARGDHEQSAKEAWFEKVFCNIFQADQDNGRRIEALRYFTQARRSDLVGRLLQETIDVSGASELITDLIDSHNIEDAELNIFQRIWKHGQLPPPTVSLADQVNTLEIAEQLVDRGAPLPQLSSYPLLPIHAKQCVSCFYLCSRMLHKQEASLPQASAS